ncbi:MAG: glycosyltransferase family 25 protein [Pseudomonadota bacterium]
MQGHYINLDRSADRRAAMTLQLQQLGFDGIERLPAVDGQTLARPARCAISQSELGCFLSHAQAIDAAAHAAVARDAVHAENAVLRLVLEDDTRLSRDLPGVLRSLSPADFGDAHIVFLDCQPYMSIAALQALYGSLRTYREDRAAGQPGRIGIYDAQALYYWGANAYLLTPRGQRELPALVAAELQAGPSLAFDMWLNRLVREQRIVASVLAPFLAAPHLENHAHSTMADRDPLALPIALQTAARAVFFADDDIDALEAYVRPHLRQLRAGERTLQLLAEMVGEMAANDFVVAAVRNADGNGSDHG